MIERNLGNIERLVRLMFGLTLALWALGKPDMNAMEYFVFTISIALILNGIFSRCYLWYLLDVDTSDRSDRSARLAGR